MVVGMALARLRGGPLDGQILPLDDTEQEELIVPYGTTQVISQRRGEPPGTGQGDGPPEVQLWFADASDDIVPSDDCAGADARARGGAQVRRGCRHAPA